MAVDRPISDEVRDLINKVTTRNRKIHGSRWNIGAHFEHKVTINQRGRSRTPENERWCSSNCQGDFSFDGAGVVSFKLLSDALMFKLAMGGR